MKQCITTVGFDKVEIEAGILGDQYSQSRSTAVGGSPPPTSSIAPAERRRLVVIRPSVRSVVKARSLQSIDEWLYLSVLLLLLHALRSSDKCAFRTGRISRKIA